MKQQFTILGPVYKYKYLVEYDSTNIKTDKSHISWCDDNGQLRLFLDDAKYYREQNEWYDRNTIPSEYFCDYHIPDFVDVANIKLFIPNLSASTHYSGIKYMVSVNTWVNGIEIDLGSYLFKPTDAIAIESGPIKRGNNEYFEYISFDILDPYPLMYNDDWEDFRYLICNEPRYINQSTTSLFITLYIVSEYEDKFIIHNDFIGSCNSCLVVKDEDVMEAKLEIIQEPKLGFRFSFDMNSSYDSIIDYIKETYNMNLSSKDIKFNIIIRNNTSAAIIPGPTVSLDKHVRDRITNKNYQDIYWDNKDLESFKLFFSSWNDYEDGWYFMGSMTFNTTFLDEKGNVDEEIESKVFLTNEIIITQELYSIFANGGSEKVDISNLNINKFNIVNKLYNTVEIIDRPNYIKNSSVLLANGDNAVPLRIKRPDTFTIRKSFTKPLIKNIK